jgi:hypothetical protein
VAVRIVLPDGGETVFSYATTATARGAFLGVYAWEPGTQTLVEITLFRMDAFVKAEVTRAGVVIATIPGHARRSA